MRKVDQHIASVGQQMAIAMQQISIVDHPAGFANRQKRFVNQPTAFVSLQKRFVNLQTGLYSGRLEVNPLIQVPEAVPRPGYGPADVGAGMKLGLP
ncbi:MAG: hypothetical protein J0H55_16355 [Chitinophagaceae bacterium]|nr:hypothetical protein [Chitinophagaceae bacterium]